MTVLGLLEELRSHGVEIKADGDYLELDAPAGALTPELVSELKAHKVGILRTLERRERVSQDPKPIGSAGQVFEMAREFFGPSEPFDLSEHPVSKRELWVDPEKAAFYRVVDTRCAALPDNSAKRPPGRLPPTTSETAQDPLRCCFNGRLHKRP